MKLKVLKKNLTFSEALQALKERKWIKCPEWSGYWFLEVGMINVMKHDGVVTTTPWLEATVLREDWQIVENDISEMLEAFRNQPMQFYKREDQELDMRTHTPVMGNSHAFHDWLTSQDIEWKPSGHQTIIIGDRDMFHIGEAWAKYKQANQPPTNNP